MADGLSTARGKPSFQTCAITDFSSFTGVVKNGEGKDVSSSDPAYKRLTNGYAGQSSKAILTDDEEKQVALFEMERMVFRGEEFSNPKLWARLKRLGPVAYIQSLIDKMK